jgi:hypothetical protein
VLVGWVGRVTMRTSASERTIAQPSREMYTRSRSRRWKRRDTGRKSRMDWTACACVCARRRKKKRKKKKEKIGRRVG